MNFRKVLTKFLKLMAKKNKLFQDWGDLPTPPLPHTPPPGLDTPGYRGKYTTTLLETITLCYTRRFNNKKKITYTLYLPEK
jgi:hypothetical protein